MSLAAKQVLFQKVELLPASYADVSGARNAFRYEPNERLQRRLNCSPSFPGSLSYRVGENPGNEVAPRLAASVKRVVIFVSRAFCSTEEENRETARSV